MRKKRWVCPYNSSVVVWPFLISEMKEICQSTVLVTKRLESASRLLDRVTRMSKHIEIRGLKETVCIGKEPQGRRSVSRHWLPAHHCFPCSSTQRVLTWGQMHLSLTHEFLKGVSNGKRQEAK